MTTEELVSVIVPVYNCLDYLPRCLSCIEIQTYHNLEIILVDDGSTDGSGRLCDEFAAKDSRARVIHHPENRGLWATRNTGQDAAHGEYIWMPDGDDYFHKDIIKVMHEAINLTNTRGEKYDMAIVGYKKTDKLNENVYYEYSPLLTEKTLYELWSTYSHPVYGFSAFTMWGKFCRKDLLEGVYNDNYKYAQDRYYSIQLFLKEPNVIAIYNPLYYYVERCQSAIHSQDYWRIRYQCETNFLYKALLSLPDDKQNYRFFLLDALYRCMANWLDCVNYTDKCNSVRNACHQIVQKTGSDFLNCCNIMNKRKRLGRLLRIRYNGLYNFFIEYVSRYKRKCS